MVVPNAMHLVHLGLLFTLTLLAVPSGTDAAPHLVKRHWFWPWKPAGPYMCPDVPISGAVHLKKTNRNVALPDFAPGHLMYLANKYNTSGNIPFRNIPPHRLSKRQNPVATTPLTNYYSLSFYGPAKIGNQEFLFNFDTGSSELWVPSTQCTTCTNPRKYNSLLSATFKLIGDLFGISYASGSASGTTIQDSFTIGNLTIPNHVLGLVTSATKDDSAEWDGIAGMSFSSLSGQTKETWFERGVKTGIIEAPLFGFYLSSGSGEEDGELAVGGVSLDRMAVPQWSYVRVVAPFYWELDLKEIRYGNEYVERTVTSVIVDTGTSLVVGPYTDVVILNDFIGAVDDGGGLFSIDCSFRDIGKPIQFRLDGYTIELEAKEYVLYYDGQCFSTFQYIENLQFWILGGTVLRKYYSVYNIGDYKNDYYGAAVGFQLVKDYPDNPGDLTPRPTSTTTATGYTTPGKTTTRTTTAVASPTEYGMYQYDTGMIKGTHADHYLVGQCGGEGWFGTDECPEGFFCQVILESFSAPDFLLRK
ncbi:hypothetical protein HK097_007825 [Rhizophlyctis rosea]|uniref:rhizopuspepsin n=1 Tax=Rhizophlyctis rosea TaxID=64517 RepID=A0AAD5SB33_9FUNG|nr:hypothetical protein HK097_007825 [Rhizophlyctis rosea]